MRTLLALLATAGTFALVSTEASACNARGQYCGQPQWASNAFSGPHAQTPKGAIVLEHLNHGRYKRVHRGYYGHKPKYIVKKVIVKKYIRVH